MEVTLRTYLREKMLREHLSARQAGEQSGVAHTTILRILEGRNVSLDTLDKVSDWLGVKPGSVIGGNDLDSNISAILGVEPELHQVFSLAMEKVRRGELQPETVREIIRYVSWRVGYQDANTAAVHSNGGDHLS